MYRHVNESHELLDSLQRATETTTPITTSIPPMVPTLGSEPQSIFQLRASEGSSNPLPGNKSSMRELSGPVSIENITSKDSICFHEARSKYYLVRRKRCRCGKGFNSRPELTSPAGHSDSCRWLEAWATDRRVAEKFGFEVIGATASWYEEWKKSVNRSENSSRQTWHGFELSPEWNLSWITLSRFEEIAIIKEAASRKGLEYEKSVLGRLRQRMDTTQDPELWQEINSQFTAIQESITCLIDTCYKSHAHRTATENLTRFFLVHCELHPNQFVPSRYLPELGLVDHGSLALLQNALNQARKARAFGRRDLWLRDLIATRLSEDAAPCLSKILQNLPQDIQKAITDEDGLTIVVEYDFPAAEFKGKENKKRKHIAAFTDSATDFGPSKRQKGLAGDPT